MTNEKKAEPPVSKTKIGLFEITAWKQTKDNKTWLNYQLQKSYKDKDNNWQAQKINLNASDLPKLALVAQKAYEDHYTKSPESED